MSEKVLTPVDVVFVVRCTDVLQVVLESCFYVIMNINIKIGDFLMKRDNVSRFESKLGVIGPTVVVPLAPS